MNFLLIFSIFSSIFAISGSYKILVYSPRFAISHVTFMGKIADTLVEAGHDVTVLQPAINQQLPNITGTSKARVIIIGQSPDVKETYPKIWKEFKNPWIREPSFPRLIQSSVHYARQCNYTILQKDIMNELRDQKFDVGITELFEHCGPALFHVLGTKTTVLTASTVAQESINGLIGLPNMYSYVPVSVARGSDNMDFSTRVKSLITMLGLKYYYYRYRVEMANVLNWHFGSDAPVMEELIGNAGLVLTNSHPYLDFPHPTLEKIIDIGGISVAKAEPLSKEWDSILNKRKENVFVSFGSVAFSSIMPEEWKQAILKAMKALPDVTFIWKYEDLKDSFSSDANGVPNVVLTEWAPQVDLLSDPRLSLFVTHGGLGSVYETVFSKKPALFVPLFADQFRNAEMCVRKNISISIGKDKLADSEFLKETITKLLRDPSYRLAAEKTAHRMSLRPFDSRTQLIKNVELAAELGDMSFLIPASRNMGFIPYFNLDVIALVVLIIVVILVAALILIHLIVKLARRILFGKQKTE